MKLTGLRVLLGVTQLAFLSFWFDCCRQDQQQQIRTSQLAAKKDPLHRERDTCQSDDEKSGSTNDGKHNFPTKRGWYV